MNNCAKIRLFSYFCNEIRNKAMRKKTNKEKFIEWLGKPYMLLLYRLLAILLALSISRWMLYLFNSQYFHQLREGQALQLFLYGMRFDLSMAAVFGLPVILYYCFPSKFIFERSGQRVVDFSYITFSSLAILLNFIDIVCFNFLGKHITINYLKTLGRSGELTFGLFRQVLFDYWYLLVIFVLFVLIICVVARHTKLKEETEISRWPAKQTIRLFVALALAFIAWRGGLQKERITMQTALRYTDPQNAPILLNTPFCLLNGEDAPKPIKTPSGESHFTAVHTDLTPNRFLIDTMATDTLPANVVVIIMESIGQEMTGYYNPNREHLVTPFLDSLLSQSLTFNGMANSRKSLEVLPSILASLPALMDDDFVNSTYANQDFDAFCQHLQARGYNTIFMHGGNNGVMGYDKFAQRAGFKRYFGRVEYGDDSDYDGSWGIFDGPFLQYAASTLSRVHEPFASAVYTLSSRYPYKTPRHFKFPEESYFWTGFEKTVYYSDCALRDFFGKAQQQPWYGNTLFVITADCSNNLHFQSEYNNVWGMYAIPIAFYWPNRIEAKKTNEVAQQIDLGPSILSALNVNDTLLSFGRNLFDSLSEPSFISYFNLTYQYYHDSYLVQSDGQNSFGIYKPIDDPLMSDNLIDRLQCPDIFEKMYDFLREYNNRLNFNELKPIFNSIHEQAKDTIYH